MVWQTGKLFYMEIQTLREHQITHTGQIIKAVSRGAYLLSDVIRELIFKYIHFTGCALNYVRSLCQCGEKRRKSALFLWQVIESSDVNSVGYGEGLTLPSASMSLWGPGKKHCSSEGHKKGINLNLVYNAMPFKLIHLACALELPATPSVLHSLCQLSLSAAGVNVNSTAARRDGGLRDAGTDVEDEDGETFAGKRGF